MSQPIPALGMEPEEEVKGEEPVDPPSGSTEEGIPKLTAELLAAIKDEEVLDKMLDEATDFEERKMIRAAMRELCKMKRAQREQERASRQQQWAQQKSGPGGCAVGAAVKKAEKPADTCGPKVHLLSQASSSTPHSRTVGSIFNRGGCSPLQSGGGRGGVAELERRQAERCKEQARAKDSTPQGQQAIMARLERATGGPVLTQVARVPRSSGTGAANRKDVKQMLLDWCRAKTYSYENVDIQNFSSSWSDGLAFCALVHRFFPDEFDYTSLSPANRRDNFQIAFSTAEKRADCPPLLDVEDMVRMQEPDWKCVYTYIQEFYRGLVQKGLVKTKKAP
ncbi:smoothelin [Megalops cyprinoides]|uniref:smoothelin n=1 Tax=Megalops cyprinoides TaxID=118141 RepID=UPI001864F987|nr:smoothelin [Megalops cyprinoides]